MKKEIDRNTDTLIEFISTLLLMKVSPADLREMENPITIPVPFPRKVFDQFAEILSAEKVTESLADLIRVCFFNAILECAKNYENEIRTRSTGHILNQAIKSTVSMN